MSRNNLILVVRDKRFGRKWCYVITDVCADTQWNLTFARKYIKEKVHPRTKDRGTALILAHNLQQRIQTEYGVNEMILKK